MALSGGGAMAATVITLDQSVNGQPGRPQVMYLDTDKLRMSSPENDMIYRGDQSKVWIVRPQDKAFAVPQRRIIGHKLQHAVEHGQGLFIAAHLLQPLGLALQHWGGIGYLADLPTMRAIRIISLLQDQVLVPVLWRCT